MEVSLSTLQEARDELRDVVTSKEIVLDLPLDEAGDLVIALMHGMTELHLANNPELPVGEGRFGKLIPRAVKLFLDAWRTTEQNKE